MRLDDYTFPRVDLVKIDVEGAEREVLEGAEETLKKHHPMVYVEVHSPRVRRHTLEKLFRDFNYPSNRYKLMGGN